MKKGRVLITRLKFTFLQFFICTLIIKKMFFVADRQSFMTKIIRVEKKK